MVTLVGTEEDFGKALKELIELEYDAIEAYEAAINRLDNEEYRDHLTSFKSDHMRHVSEISTLLKDHNIDPPTEASLVKQWLAKGKVIIGNLVGDLQILQAMRRNEIDTNTAYERLNEHKHIWLDARGILAQGLKDEQKHKKWLEDTLDLDNG